MRLLERKIRCLGPSVGYETALPVFPLAAWSVYGRYTGYPPTAVSRSHPSSCFSISGVRRRRVFLRPFPFPPYEIPEGGVGKGQCMTDSRLRPYSQYRRRTIRVRTRICKLDSFFPSSQSTFYTWTVDSRSHPRSIGGRLQYCVADVHSLMQMRDGRGPSRTARRISPRIVTRQ